MPEPSMNICRAKTQTSILTQEFLIIVTTTGALEKFLGSSRGPPSAKKGPPQVPDVTNDAHLGKALLLLGWVGGETWRSPRKISGLAP